jgi:adenylate cyclase
MAGEDLMDDAERLDYDDLWRRVLAGTQSNMRAGRRLLRHLPSDPRCKLCAAPFGGLGGTLMRLVGKRRWPRNPKFCSQCFSQLTDHHGGAEIDCSLMFADVRGSTSMGEAMRPSEVHKVMDRFFDTAAQVLVEHDAIVDRFVGDQAIGIFVPALAGADHAARAIAAARALLVATGHGQAAPWVPVGAGVHTGIAFVGAVGTGSAVDFTALGDAVNIASRLASAAAPGEVLVSVDASRAAEFVTAGLERRDLVLKGRSAATPVVVMHGGSAPMS